MVGKTSAELTFPEDLALLSHAHAKRSTGQGSSYEMRLKHSNGRAVYVLVNGVPRWRNQQSVASIAVVTDLTERKQMEEGLRESEARFRELFEASPEAVVLLDPSQNRLAHRRLQSSRLSDEWLFA